MTQTQTRILVALMIATTSPGALTADDSQQYDVVIYGTTSGGVAAAVQASRMGQRVILVGPDKQLGGMSSSGLGFTDSGDKAVIGGISLEFYQRIRREYQKPDAWRWQEQQELSGQGSGSRRNDGGKAMWVFEPHVAERVFEDMVREHDIPVHRDQWLDRTGPGVVQTDGRILSIRMLSGKTYRAKMFIDATYEGDLMAEAGVSYTVGREPNSQYGETLNGVQPDLCKHQFEKDVSAYKVSGDATSGLLPRISSEAPGELGEGDRKLQAYCFRMCLTRVPENRVPFPKPEHYDASQYELLLRLLQADGGWPKAKFDALPNGKTDTNNAGGFSTDNIGMNYDYPEASYERRKQIITEHRTYQQGYHWFLANDPRVPADIRLWYSQWGLAKDEFVDNGHWPYQIYVREARRMVSDFVLTENHIRGTVKTPRPIGMGSYTIDSHNVQRYVDAAGHVRNEGDVQVRPPGPYPIDYGAVTPKKQECANLLVVCAVSSSHIAYGSVRMEPVFMVLGQSAATGASMAIASGVAVQDVSYPELAARLMADGQVLTAQPPTSPAGRRTRPHPDETHQVMPHDANGGPVAGLGHAASNATPRQTPGLMAFQRRAQAGHPLNVVFFGGSLTWGSNASDPQITSYRAIISRRLQDEFSHAQFRFWDAAIGGTDSQLAVFRLERDVLARRPDLVFLDFTANDEMRAHDVEHLAAYEAIVRRLAQEGVPVCIVILPFRDHAIQGDTLRMPRRDAHLRLAKVYGMPVADVISEVQKQIAARSVTASELWPWDGAHPGDAGYQLFADAIWKALAREFREMPTLRLPVQALHGASYSNVVRVRLAQFEHKLPKGWRVDTPNRTAAWFDGLMSRWLDQVVVAEVQGRTAPASLHLDIRGGMIGVLGEETMGGGKYRAWIDDNPVTVGGSEWINTSAKKFGGNRQHWQVLATGLPEDRPHYLRIEPVLDENGAHAVRIESICVAGMLPPSVHWRGDKARVPASPAPSPQQQQ